MIKLWYPDFDSRKVAHSLEARQLNPFDREIEINNLKLFPSYFLDEADKEERRAKLVKRGKKWFHLLTGGMFDYDGELFDRLEKHVRLGCVRNPIKPFSGSQQMNGRTLSGAGLLSTMPI
jgi:hypothetical protein